MLVYNERMIVYTTGNNIISKMSYNHSRCILSAGEDGTTSEEKRQSHLVSFSVFLPLFENKRTSITKYAIS